MNSRSPTLVAEAPGSSAPAPASSAAPAGGWPVAILGVPFDSVTIPGALARIEAMIASRRPHYVVTANVDFLVQAQRDVELRRILLDADLVLCDGTPLVWASRWLGNALPERVAGSDLAPQLIRTAAERGHRLFFLGAAPGVAAEAERKLREQHPGINIVGTYAPPFSPLLDMDHDEIVRRVRAARPDILLVSFGCPKQEKWIAMHHRALGVPVAIGVGATLDFLAGRVRRAPQWMRRSGTEWLYRLAQEPRRLVGRYANDLFFFLPALARQWWHVARDTRNSGRPHEVASPLPGWHRYEAGARLTRRSLDRDAAVWRGWLDRETHCLLDVSRLCRIDSTGLAFLVQWRKEFLKRGRHLLLLAPSRPLRRTLAALRLTDHFALAADAIDATEQAQAFLEHARVERRGETRTIAWRGEVSAANTDDVWRLTTEHLVQFVAENVTLVIVDLRGVRFIDSAGAASMLRLKRWARELRTEVMFSDPQPNVRNVLRLTAVDQLLLEGAQ